MTHQWTRALATAAVILLAAGAAHPRLLADEGQAQLDRPARIGGRPNFNGIWQAVNTAYWNLENHSAEDLKPFWQMGAIAAIPAGTSVPRVTYHNMPFQIFQGEGDLLMVYPFAAANRVINMADRSELPVDSWMGKSDGKWDGDVMVIVTKWQNGQSWLDRAGNHASNQLTVTERFRLLGTNHLWYEATLDDPQTYTRPWTIEMPLYRLIDQQAQLLEHKCVTFADGLLYHDLIKKDSK